MSVIVLLVCTHGRSTGEWQVSPDFVFCVVSGAGASTSSVTGCVWCSEVYLTAVRGLKKIDFTAGSG